METGQNLASTQNQSDTNPKNDNLPDGQLKLALQQAWVDYNALGGLITDLLEDDKIITDRDGKQRDGVMRKMPIREFAEMIGVSRETLRTWRGSIPDFWSRVAQRRREIGTQARMQKVHEVWFLSALKPGSEGFRDRQLFLANFDTDFHMPTEKVEHEMGNSWAALIESKRKVVDVDGSSTDNPS